MGLIRKSSAVLGYAWSPLTPLAALQQLRPVSPLLSQVALSKTSETLAGIAPERFWPPPAPTLLSLKRPKSTQGAKGRGSFPNL